jgi:predicted transcriptional regulator
MSTSSIETFIRNAKEQVSQSDINESMLRALAEVSRELKQLEDEVHRVRREVQMGRRFG